MRAVRRAIGDGRGAALLTALLFTALMFILVSAMLITVGKEITMAGLHRDAIRAEELAQAGLEDKVRRMEGGRAWRPGSVDDVDRCTQDGGASGVRVSLPGADACMSSTSRAVGPSGSFFELRSDAVVARARRRLSTALLARTGTAFPGILALREFIEDPGTEVGSGEVHVETLVRYIAPVSADRPTYAGWRIAQSGPLPGEDIGPCYTHAECVLIARPQWWPGHRRAVHAGQSLRPAPLPGNPTPDPRLPGTVLAYPCPAGPPPAQANQVIGSDGPGFAGTDLRADLNPGDRQQMEIAAELLYGCTVDGLPYTWLREAFDTDGDPDADPDRFLWFKVVRLDHWLTRYACFDETALAWMPCNGYHPDPIRGNPSLGAVLPRISIPVWSQNYDQRRTGGGVVTPADLDLGSCADPPLCRRPVNIRRMIVLEGGDYELVCPGGCPEGHGVLLVDGDFLITGAFTYRGVMAVRGTLTLSSGSATVHGAVYAGRVARRGGTLRLLPGTLVATGAAGPMAVTRRAWWER